MCQREAPREIDRFFKTSHAAIIPLTVNEILDEQIERKLAESMTYAETIEFLYGLRLFGLKLGLENTRRLAAQAGNPQDQLRFIHIAGTNGKGSVAAMLESIYRAAGLRVGLYTSPHLVSFRERIQVNRQLISEADVVRLAAGMRRTGFQPVPSVSPESDEASPSARHANPPAPQPRSSVAARVNCQRDAGSTLGEDRQEACATFFEFVTVMALRYFAEQKCDLVIWETGLGGRLDATNIVTPLASVITNVEHDHQRWLGHDLKSIAFEKAGIIKPGVPVLTATSEPEALAVIQETALAQKSPLTLVTPAHTEHPPLDKLRLPLHGWHQRMNAAVASATVQTLHTEIPVGEEALRNGLSNVQWPGRLQVIELEREHSCPPGTCTDSHADKNVRTPKQLSEEAHCGRRIVLDGAHNASGATVLRAALEEEFAGERPALILGIMEDKDWFLMCEILAPLASRILCVPVKSERGADPAKLAEACRRTNPSCPVDVCDSLGQAIELTAAESFVVIAGSLYLVGEAMELLHVEAAPQQDEKVLNEWKG